MLGDIINSGCLSVSLEFVVVRLFYSKPMPEMIMIVEIYHENLIPTGMVMLRGLSVRIVLMSLPVSK